VIGFLSSKIRLRFVAPEDVSRLIRHADPASQAGRRGGRFLAAPVATRWMCVTLANRPPPVFPTQGKYQTPRSESQSANADERHLFPSHARK
jgi:hypothetical protein